MKVSTEIAKKVLERIRDRTRTDSFTLVITAFYLGHIKQEIVFFKQNRSLV